MTTWRTVLWTASLLLCSWTSLAGATHPVNCGIVPAQPAASQPNLIVIMLDDLDTLTLNQGLAHNLFPNIQNYLVDQGFTFSRFYVTNSLCCPSRATLLKGQYSHNHPFKGNVDPLPVIDHMHDCDTLPVKLQEKGYRTSLIGKYLSLYGMADVDGDGIWPLSQDLTKRQFDPDDQRVIPPGWHDWAGFIDPWNFSMYGYRVNDNGQITIPSFPALTLHQTDYVAWRALQFLDSVKATHDTAPFFLALMPTTPHVEATPGAQNWHDAIAWDIRPARRYETMTPPPFPTPPSFNEADVSDKPQWLIDRHGEEGLSQEDQLNLIRHYGNRLRTMRSIDDLVGALVLKLAQQQELSRTVILFTSDNGFLLGQHGLAQKLYAYEASINVPLFVRLPQGTRASSDRFVLNNDLAPTLLQLAGSAIPNSMDGTSFVPLFQSPQLDWRRRFLVEHERLSTTFLEVPSYKAVRTSPTDAGIADVLYVEYDEAGQTPEFYTPDDPAQLQSKHSSTDPARIAQMNALRTLKNALATCSGAMCRALEFCGSGSCSTGP